MNIMSESPQDGHASLIAKAKSALAVHEELLARAQTELRLAEDRVAAFKAMPFYKRWFAISKPWICWESTNVFFVEKKIEFLNKVLDLAQSNFTIELDDREVDILTRKL